MQRILLNIGIACIVIAMVMELNLNNKFALVFAVMLAYLISLRGRMDGRAGFRDAHTELVLSENISLIYLGSVMEKGHLS